MKFGGSSVANAQRIRNMAEIVISSLDRKPVLVLSAMGDTTDNLLEAANAALKTGNADTAAIEKLHINTIKELGIESFALADTVQLIDELKNLLSGIFLVGELSGRTKDYLVSFGERLCVRIAAAYFNSMGIKASAVDAWDGGFLTDSNFTSAELAGESWELIPSKLLTPAADGVLQVVTGFIAKDGKGNITTLGRGGSDLTATMIGASCGAQEVQVWKDVDGILTADPKLVKNAQVVEAVTYDAAAELAYFGAQVLHPMAMQPCIKTGTPLLVKNSYNPKAPGTRVVKSLAGEEKLLQAITFRKNISVVDIVSTRMLGQYGFLSAVFSCFAKHGICVDVVTTSVVSISIILDASYDLGDLKKELSQVATVEVKTGKAVVAIIGDVSRSSEILACAFNTCKKLGVQVQTLSHGASKLNICFAVNEDEAGGLVKALHNDFFG